MCALLLLLSLLASGCSDSHAAGFLWGRRGLSGPDITYVKDAHNSFQDQNSCPSCSITGVTAGDSLVFVNSHTCGGGGIGHDPTPTDSAGQTWTVLNRPNCLDDGTTGVNAAIWYLLNANAGTHTSSQTYANGTWGNWTIAEFRGPTAVDFVTSGSGETGAQDSVTTGSTQTTSATANPKELVIVGLATNSQNAGIANTAFTNPPTGYSSLLVQNDTINFAGGQISYRITTTTGTQAATWTWTNTGNQAETVWRAVIGVLK